MHEVTAWTRANQADARSKALSGLLFPVHARLCKRRDFGTSYVLENQLGFYVRNFLARRESGHRQVAQVVGVARPDMDKEVDRPRYMVKLHDLGQAERMLPESIDIRLEMAYQPDRYHGLDTYPETGRCNLRVEPTDYTAALQEADADQAGRGRQANLPRDLLV